MKEQINKTQIQKYLTKASYNIRWMCKLKYDETKKDKLNLFVFIPYLDLKEIDQIAQMFLPEDYDFIYIFDQQPDNNNLILILKIMVKHSTVAEEIYLFNKTNLTLADIAIAINDLWRRLGLAEELNSITHINSIRPSNENKKMKKDLFINIKKQVIDIHKTISKCNNPTRNIQIDDLKTKEGIELLNDQVDKISYRFMFLTPTVLSGFCKEYNPILPF